MGTEGGWGGSGDEVEAALAAWTRLSRLGGGGTPRVGCGVGWALRDPAILGEEEVDEPMSDRLQGSGLKEGSGRASVVVEV